MNLVELGSKTAKDGFKTKKILQIDLKIGKRIQKPKIG